MRRSRITERVGAPGVDLSCQASSATTAKKAATTSKAELTRSGPDGALLLGLLVAARTIVAAA